MMRFLSWLVVFALAILPAQSQLLTGVSQVINAGSCSGINLLTSGDFTSGWTAGNATLTPNTVVGPTGATDGATLVEASDIAKFHDAFQEITKATSSITYTLSVFVKQAVAGSARNLALYIEDDSGANFVVAEYNAATGAFITAPAAGGVGWTAAGGGSVASGNGYIRYYLIATSDATNMALADIVLMSGTSETYNGDGTSGLYAAQSMLAADNVLCPYVAPVVTAGLNFGIVANSMYIPLLGGFP